MRLSRVLRVGAVVAAASLALAACGGGEEGGDKTVLQKAQDDKKLTIGIKYDQPGLGLKTPDGQFVGFDVDVAKYVAKELGVEESGIEWKQAPSAQRENLIEKGEVDLIFATYSITDSRKEKVLFAGPYFVAHQDLLVRADEADITGPETLEGKKLCSVKGSTSAQNVADEYPGVALQNFGGYSECLTGLENGAVDAVTTDDVILAGYAAGEAGKFKLVGNGFSDENYGVGLKKGDTESRDAINAAILKMQEEGAWKAAAETHFAPAGYEVPEPPAITEK
ncbi:amino acid ABC transporter substrate-binding protein, PAAT family [Amycolatopsis marina]|uniref:Amino acid ABC transporter substrate-binding protein, PAAT family n=1 Tax=Amycolatopsis marina TaxID=490629 RepID=A0A1I1AMJ5_9PSEU|nr:glutamate ABC transporter substrate-binding protein [Amycolatopsis marina]SFB37698.1 amino acid ABC transporter substrate-binding protein, PAAT family [Amycolatopsis marina]